MEKSVCASIRFFVLSFLSITILLLALAGRSEAQVVGATLSGTVKDASGAAIPLAKVNVKNVATGVLRETTSDSAGFYSVPNLLPGNYDVTFSAAGFGTQSAAGINLTVGAQQVVNVTLTVGEVNQKVVVNVEAPTVELASSAISGEVSATTVRELPLNARSWTDLATLSAGVDAIHTQPDFATGADRGNRGFGQQLTISGARPQQNNYRMDGVSLNDYANGAPGSVMGGNLGVDAIQEFSVLTTNYSAEYGKTSGGVVNAITRSGTDAFHGTAFDFLRNSSLDAANFFEAGQRAPFRRNQFGGALGGPIRKDHTFFFADYEGIRQAKGIPSVDFVPSADARNGILSTGNVTVDPQAAKYLALYPTPQACGADVCPFLFSGQQIFNENFVTARIDQKFSASDSLYGTFIYDRTPYSDPDSFNNVLLGDLSTREIVAAEETHTFSSSFVNSARFGFNHEAVNNNQSVKAINSAAGDPSLGAFPGRDAAFVHIGGLTDMPGGSGGLPTYLYRWKSYQAYDDAFITRGTHSIKFGIAVERMLLNTTALTDPNGIWNFADLPSFLTNNPTKFQGGLASSLTPRNIRQTLVGGYVQDDWRMRPSLTLNLGVRYEFTTIPTEANGKFVNLRNLSDALPVCGASVAGCSGTGPLLTHNPSLHNFEPRIGFAWDALHNGKMAVRGGAGLFDVLPLPYEFTLMETQATPFFAYTVIGNPSPGDFPSNLPATLPANRLRSTFIESNPKRNYVMQWNLNVQYQVTANFAVMAAYVGSRGVHMPFRVDEADLVIPTKLASGRYLWPQTDVLGNIFSTANGCTATDPNATDPGICAPPDPINTHYGSVRGMFYQGRSYYNALELQASRKMSRGFQLQGVFTWAKSMDTSSATVAGDAFANSISSLNWFDMSLSRALSDFNVGRTFVLNGTWDAPTPKNLTGFARWPLDGWELGLIFTVSDGAPFTPTWGTGSDPAGTLSSDDFAYPDRLGGSGCASAVNPGNPNNYIKSQCFSLPTAPNSAFWNANCSPAPPSLGGPLASGDLSCFNLRGNSGRNILIGPGLTNLDFSIFKNNYVRRISEDFNIQFRAEIFNILNHANFGPPTVGDGNTDIFDGTGAGNPIAGALVRTVTPERQIQFALKLIW
ncbi:MAG TPA: TonB-dependent receptor [Bryobacteraceae bacterium]|nr:TonB-dependent receptor [Bryobacteraceae bacterium]